MVNDEGGEPTILHDVQFGNVRIGTLEIRGKVVEDSGIQSEPKTETESPVTPLDAPNQAPAPIVQTPTRTEQSPPEEVAWDVEAQELAGRAVAGATNLWDVLERGRHLVSTTSEDVRAINRIEQEAKAHRLEAIVPEMDGRTLSRASRSLPPALATVAYQRDVANLAIPMFLSESGRYGIGREQARTAVFRIMCEIASTGQANKEALTRTMSPRDIKARIDELYAEAVAGGELADMAEIINGFMRSLEDHGTALQELAERAKPYNTRIKYEAENYGHQKAPTMDEMLRTPQRHPVRR